MIFKQVAQALDGTKTQTRRVGFPYELARQLWRWWDYWPEPPWSWKEWLRDFPIREEQIAEANRILAEHVVTLPVQPGRGKKSVGRIRITKIRRERLGDISEEDAIAEGIAHKQYIQNPYCKWSGYYVPDDHPPGLEPQIYGHTYASVCYAVLWDTVYGRGAWERMMDDDVWVLEFERCEE